jgi:DNA invertase Pin-like site-specific DNA recombinase
MKTIVAAVVWAYSYLRFSSPAQAEGDSVRRQTALRDAWLKRHPEVRLDTTLTFEDRGVSGYRGAHRTDRRHALAQFLDLVERGRVPPGSYLIVENLDRLTREAPEDSIPLVMSLIRAGIRIVQLSPTEMVYERGMDFGRQMVMLYDLARGHGESERKSGLSGEAWTEKKSRARATKAPHGKAVPAWLEMVKGAYRVREDAGRAVRLIFKLSAEGLGTLAITARLNARKVRPIGRADKWHRSYVAKVLDNRAALGEYQPRRGHRGRSPDGEPIPGYFPAVVTEAEWHRAHSAKQARNKRSGRPGMKGTGSYVFQGLLRDALDDCPLHVITRKGVRLLTSARAVDGEAGAHWRPFPLEVFVAALLSELREVAATDLFADPGGAKVAELEGRLAAVDKRLAAARANWEADPESPTWTEDVSRYDREKRALVKELACARQEAANPLSASWEEAVALMHRDDPVRLRQALLSTVAEIRSLTVVRGRDRLLYAQVYFKGGMQRDYVVWCRQKCSGAAAAPGWWRVMSWRMDLVEQLGLTRPDFRTPLEPWSSLEDFEAHLVTLTTPPHDKTFLREEAHPLE